MSRLTLLMIVPLFAAQAQAGTPLEDAQAKRSKAYNDYYNQYKQSQRTPEDAKAIEERTLAPAAANMSKALSYEKAQALRNAGVQVLTPAQSDAAHARARKALEEAGESGEEEAEEGAEGKPSEGKGEDGKVAEKGPADSSVNPAALVRKPAAPETVIDGKAIPKEITFGGSKQAPPKKK